MSRIGRTPITVPADVHVELGEGNRLTVKGPKGTLEHVLPPQIKLQFEGASIVVTRQDDEKDSRSLHGLSRTLVSNMVEGVSKGFTKALEVQGIGYRAQKDGTNLVMNLGFSHQVIISETKEIQIDVPGPNQVIIKGIDKQKVGQFASDVRKRRPPDAYKGKGVRYAGEYVRLKEGKTGAK